MKSFKLFKRFWLRVRYPVSLPGDVAEALGIQISNYVTFEEFVNFITSPACNPTNLIKYMPRDVAESAFKCAQRSEKFSNNSLFSFYFNEGWMEFILQFDENSRLRRLYIQHKQILSDRGFEVPLQNNYIPFTSNFQQISSLSNAI